MKGSIQEGQHPYITNTFVAKRRSSEGSSSRKNQRTLAIKEGSMNSLSRLE